MRPATGENPSSTPPKLSLFSLPRQPLESPGMVTPPLHASISVPFQWEEAPGKPRPFGIIEPNSKPKSARSLDLPPRLFADAKVAHFASPTTTVDDPISGRDLSSSLSFRFPDTWAETATPTATATRGGKDGKYVGSRRWMSFRKNKEIPKGGSEISLSSGGADGGGRNVGSGDGETRVKITRFRSRRSFFRKPNSKPHLIASIYGSLKQFIPWRQNR
ncbi:uncharacterized protein At4g00950-like [Benincasa hispida]|uniref:uncharacterized protein At4g00950-like n=1 Tax=Benincasa hispida TaxID=102211 RepID=UPI0019004E2D|nr:uncharacterized protein At4g00950-like [Benincasa hispida]